MDTIFRCPRLFITSDLLLNIVTSRHGGGRPAEGGGAICPGPQPMKGPQNEEVKHVYKLRRERCLKNWMHFKVCGKMTRKFYVVTS